MSSFTHQGGDASRDSGRLNPDNARNIGVLSDPQSQYEAIQRREERLDSSFITAVKAAGTYCRPSCRAKTLARKTSTLSRGRPAPSSLDTEPASVAPRCSAPGPAGAWPVDARRA